MKLIVGLGNPGKQYVRTRHNVGFLMIDTLVPNQTWRASVRAQAKYLRTELDGRRVELLKPTTFMNSSGRAVAYAAKKHGVEPKDIIIVHDDKDIPLGEFRVQQGRGAGGHNGVASIIECLGTKDFTRVRIGIAPATEARVGDTATFVLGKLTAAETETLRGVFDRVRLEIDKLLRA